MVILQSSFAGTFLGRRWKTEGDPCRPGRYRGKKTFWIKD